MSPMIELPNTSWPYLLGYLYAILAGWLCVKALTDTLWRAVGWKGPGDAQLRPDEYQSAVVGMIERVFFVTALLLKAPLLIGVWLVLKLAGQWKRWTDDLQTQEESPRTVSARSVFQIFLVGSSASVVFAATGFALVIAPPELRPLAMGGAFVLALLCVGIIVFVEQAVAGPAEIETSTESDTPETKGRRRASGRGSRASG